MTKQQRIILGFLLAPLAAAPIGLYGFGLVDFFNGGEGLPNLGGQLEVMWTIALIGYTMTAVVVLPVFLFLYFYNLATLPIAIFVGIAVGATIGLAPSMFVEIWDSKTLWGTVAYGVLGGIGGAASAFVFWWVGLRELTGVVSGK